MLCFFVFLVHKKNQQVFTLFLCKVLTVNKLYPLEINKSCKTLQGNVWSAHASRRKCYVVRFFFPRWIGELSSQQADLKPSFASFVKKSHEQWKGGRSWFMLILILPRNSWLELVFQSQMVLCSKDLFYTRTCQQLESSPVSCAQAKLTLLCQARLGWLLLLLTSLVSSSSYKIVVLGDQHQGSCAVGICFNHSIRGGFLDDYLSLLTTGERVPQSHVVFGRI